MKQQSQQDFFNNCFSGRKIEFFTWGARNYCLPSRKGPTSQSSKVLNKIFNPRYISDLISLKGQAVENLIKWKRL